MQLITTRILMAWLYLWHFFHVIAYNVQKKRGRSIVRGSLKVCKKLKTDYMKTVGFSLLRFITRVFKLGAMYFTYSLVKVWVWISGLTRLWKSCQKWKEYQTRENHLFEKERQRVWWESCFSYCNPGWWLGWYRGSWWWCSMADWHISSSGSPTYQGNSVP